ncbi:MAG: benzoyl-CoA-dihydrodiol lyase [Magnetovibrio sp.]|nr:benzoyl-CoA-dihydrodiol lyase [Magnetovibrio sp.]
MKQIEFETNPKNYQHWTYEIIDDVAYLSMSVNANAALFEGYELKMNSYDLGVDIELYDAVQRLRFEHPEVRVVVLGSALDRMFCAGANIKMLGGASHSHKVNFCKFTNETRNAMEDASENSGQRYIAAINGTAAGGGYELALATDYILLVDDGNAAVSLPEVPLLAVLPGTGGLTRLIDKRRVRRDLADIFCTTEEGIRGKRAVDWRLVDETVASSKFETRLADITSEMAVESDRPINVKGIWLSPLERTITEEGLQYPLVTLEIKRQQSIAIITIKGPNSEPPEDTEGIRAEGADFWPLALTRQLDDVLLHLRLNETEIGLLVFRSEGDRLRGASYDQLMLNERANWLVREIILYWKRTMKRIDVTSRTLIAEILPGSCFCGFLAEILFAVDRTYMLDGQFEGDSREAAHIRLTESNFGLYPMANGLSRLETRFLGEPQTIDMHQNRIGIDMQGQDAYEFGLVTMAPDDIDWQEEIRLLIEERNSYSPDGLSGMEANLRFAGPETMETKIFGRLSAWQNWIFQRPNAVGEEGSLKRYGTGLRPIYHKERV